MRNRFILLLLTLFGLFRTEAQEAAAVDSLKQALATARTPAEKVKWMDELSRTLMNVNPAEADKWGEKQIAVAEESRDRLLMIEAYRSNGVRNMYLANQKAYSDKAIGFFNKSMELARQNRMEAEVGKAQLFLSALYLMIPDNEKALSYATQAFSLISTLSDDSLKAEAHNVYGQVYLARNENILALRNFLSALRLAEKTRNVPLLRNCYSHLCSFYDEIEDYDKAIDYMTLAYQQLDRMQTKNVPYQRVVDINTIGNLFSKKKNYDIAITYFQRSIRMADSLKFSTLKIPGYVSLLNQYLRLDEPKKALDYLRSPEGSELRKYLTAFNMGTVVDQALGLVFTELGQFDSARIYLEKARPLFENSSNEGQKINFYVQLASFYRRSGDLRQAIDYYRRVHEMAGRNGMLDLVKGSAKQLDTLYGLTGQTDLAGQYKAVYYQYKDSIDKLKREKELTQVEAADEQQRQQRLQEEREEARKRRNNIQYMAITIGIVALFVALVVLGMFKVSRGLIKAIGFFVFLLLFEFIFLVFKKNIYAITEGEPWKDLAFMIGLAAILVPLHHWLEHRVLHYLTSHNRLTAAGQQLKTRIFRRSNES